MHVSRMERRLVDVRFEGRSDRFRAFRREKLRGENANQFTAGRAVLLTSEYIAQRRDRALRRVAFFPERARRAPAWRHVPHGTQGSAGI